EPRHPTVRPLKPRDDGAVDGGHEHPSMPDPSGMPRSVVLAGRIERAIVLLRGHRVILDAQIAALYGVETRTLLQAVKRNRERFREDFLFQLSRTEFANLRSQTVISSW